MGEVPPRESTSVTYQCLDAVLWQGGGRTGVGEVPPRESTSVTYQYLDAVLWQGGGRRGVGEVPPRESTSVTYQYLDAVLWQGKGEGVWVRWRHGRVHQLLTNAWTQCCGRGKGEGVG